MILNKDKSRVEDFLKEVNVLQKLSHPNIVKFYGICVTQKQLCLIFEWMERGSKKKKIIFFFFYLFIIFLFFFC